jgi:hypothetical protein
MISWCFLNCKLIVFKEISLHEVQGQPKHTNTVLPKIKYICQLTQVENGRIIIWEELCIRVFI